MSMDSSELCIGIDFDNTIANYENVFQNVAKEIGAIPRCFTGTKLSIRNYLSGTSGKQRTWQRLQGQVYGRHMHRASIMPGFAWFLCRCQRRGVSVVIISHKTEYGHFDSDRTPLRVAAFKWIQDQGFLGEDGFGIKKENIYFEDTRQKKIERISRLGITHFIDDLPEVLHDSEFPKRTQKVLFSVVEPPTELPSNIVHCQSWEIIGQHILGPENDDDNVFVARKTVKHLDIESCTFANAGGNNRVYVLTTTNSERLMLKRYGSFHNDGRDRLSTEYGACRFLKNHGIEVVPSAVAADKKLDLGVFEWIDGEKILKPDSEDINKALEFVQILDDLHTADGACSLNTASEACLSGMDICRQIHARRKILEDISQASGVLKDYLCNCFDPSFQRTKQYTMDRWSMFGSFEEELPKQYQTLSLSDFGFHNSLRQKDGRIRFVDLEYFGWDDPVKLVSDFWWHPGMDLSFELKSLWLLKSKAIFTRDTNFVLRLGAAHPMYGLRWALIVLNSVIKCYNGHISSCSDDVLRSQLDKSRRLCKVVDELIS